MRRLFRVKENLHRAATISAALAAAVILATARLAALQQTNLPAWPMLGHDPAHSGRIEYNAGTNSGVVKWKFQPYGTEHRLSIPAIGTNGIIYVAGQEDDQGTHTHSSHLYAISPGGTQLGALRTASRLSTENEASPAVGSDGTIYATGVENIYNAVPTRVYVCAVRASGVLLWESEIEGQAVSSPTLGNNGLIYVGTADTYGNGHLYAIEPNGGIR